MDKKTNHKTSLKISQDVIEAIAKGAALEVEGVAGVSETNTFSGVFAQGLSVKPVSIKISDGAAEVNLRLDLNFGMPISKVCENVQKNVKENVQTMTGIMVSKVNVYVEGIKFPNSTNNEQTKNNKPENTEETVNSKDSSEIKSK